MPLFWERQPSFFAALYFVQRRRIEKLTERIEDFLVTGRNPLEYSVREDSIAPVHNAAAELENRILLSHEQVRNELRRISMLTADISHQLKTPLSSLKLFCELDESAHMEEQLGQIERMEKLIYSLFRLERLCADGYDFFSIYAHRIPASPPPMMRTSVFMSERSGSKEGRCAVSCHMERMV